MLLGQYCFIFSPKESETEFTLKMSNGHLEKGSHFDECHFESDQFEKQ